MEYSLLRRRSLVLVIILLLLTLGLAVRLYRLHDFPVGLFRDEAANGMDALDILSGRHPIFFERNTGREPLFIYLQAISVALLGATPFALRLVSAIIGALTAPAVYWMVYETFKGTAPNPQWLGLWTGLFVALSYWHLSFSRIGFRAILLPLLTALVFAFFWRGWRRIASGGPFAWRELLLCGVCVGLAQYTYIAARLIPLLVVLLALAGAYAPGRSVGRTKQAILAVLVVGGAALLVFAPLGAYFWTHPDSFFGRAKAVSIFNAGLNQGSSLRSLVDGVVRTAGMFGISGDPNLRHNPAARPAFDPILGAWLAAGSLLALLRCRRLPYMFALLWLAVFALPAVLTADGLPHSLRSLGMLPAAYLLPVLAMDGARGWLSRHVPLRRLAIWLPLPFLLFSSITGIRDYFAAWQPRDKFDLAFSTPFVDIAPVLAQNATPDTVWILPFYNMGEAPIVDDILGFLGAGRSNYRLVQVNQDGVAAELTAATQGFRNVRLVHWPETWSTWNGLYTLDDPKHQLDFLLRKYSPPVAGDRIGAFAYTEYLAPDGVASTLAERVNPVALSFGGKVALTGAAFGPMAAYVGQSAAELEGGQAPAGGSVWAVLQWKAQELLEGDVKISLYLTDEAGHLAGQVDDLLTNDRFPYYPVWEPGQVANTYSVLPVLAAIPVGKYQLHIAVYDGKNQQRYPVFDANGNLTGSSALMATLEVVRSALPQAVAAAHPLPTDNVLAPGLRLLGYDLPAGPISPGNSLALTLFWQADAQPIDDYQVSVELVTADGQIIAQKQGRPGNGSQPTRTWRGGDTLRDWHDLPVPADTPTGAYRLVVGLHGNTNTGKRMILQDVTVTGRPHIMTSPAPGNVLPTRVGSSIIFVGYDLDRTVIAPGADLNLTLYWQALEPVDHSYTVFVHLLGPDGKIWGQQDNVPGHGDTPTNSWIAGEFLTDHHTVPLQTGAPPGDYRVELGMYDAASGARLAVTGEQGRVQGDLILLPMVVRVR